MFVEAREAYTELFGAQGWKSPYREETPADFLDAFKNFLAEKNMSETWQNVMNELKKISDWSQTQVTGLNEKILQAALNVKVGEKIQAGALTLSVKKNIADGDVRVDSGVVAVSDFIAHVKNLPPVKEISFDFVSPVSFRIDDFDAPYPRAELIFASLADKWTQAELPAADKKIFVSLPRRFT